MAKTKTKPEVKTKPVTTMETPKLNPTDWRDPDASFADDDDSLQARMWRLYQHQKGVFAK